MAAITVPVMGALTAAVVEASMMTAEVPGGADTVAAVIGCFGYLYSYYDSSCNGCSDNCCCSFCGGCSDSCCGGSCSDCSSTC
jgi:hypothetical protein